MTQIVRTRTKENFDLDWLFYYGDEKNAEKTSYPDNAWRRLELPHDWSLEGCHVEINVNHV